MLWHVACRLGLPVHKPPVTATVITGVCFGVHDCTLKNIFARLKYFLFFVIELGQRCWWSVKRRNHITLSFEWFLAAISLKKNNALAYFAIKYTNIYVLLCE